MMAAIFFAALFSGVCRLKVGNELPYRPDAGLLEAERRAAEIFGENKGLLPDVERQRENLALVRELYRREGASLRRDTGLPESAFALSDAVIDPKGELTRILDSCAGRTYRTIGIAAVILMFLAIATLGKTALKVMFPSLLSVAATAGILGWMGEELTFFHALAFLIFTGLGIDYSIFRLNGGRRLQRVISVSFLTSFVGLGMLGFTEFPITRSMGITTAIGLALSYLAAVVFIDDGKSREEAADEAKEWYDKRERAASPFWIRVMWLVYRFAGKNMQKTFFAFGMPIVYLLVKPARRQLRNFYAVLSEFTGRRYDSGVRRIYAHVLGFSWSVMDKTDVCTLGRAKPKVTIRNDEDGQAIQALVGEKRGAFLISSHLGTAEVLPAVEHAPKAHGFQQMGTSSLFMREFMRHFDSRAFELHAVEEVGVETAVEMKQAIERGEVVVMAGDRVGAGDGGVLHHRFLGRDCRWPKGVFRFARLMEAPVFAVNCVCVGWNRYEASFARLPTDSDEAMLDAYLSALERETIRHPDQWYNFHDFFNIGKQNGET